MTVQTVTSHPQQRPQQHPPGLPPQLPESDALAVAAGDAALVAVLRGKPATEQIPSAVWWLVAETLRSSVALRRRLVAGVATDDDSRRLVVEAGLLAELALAELADATDTRPRPSVVPAIRGETPPVAIQLSVLRMARLLVNQRPTSAQTLATALSEHLRALAMTHQAVGPG